MTSRKKPGVAFWATVVVVVVLVGYPLSFGPAIWMCLRLEPLDITTVFAAYQPLRWIPEWDPRLADAIDWYANAGAPAGMRVSFNPCLPSFQINY